MTLCKSIFISSAHKFHSSCRIRNILLIIKKGSCIKKLHVIFIYVLNKIFHIPHVYIYSTRENCPIQFYIPLNLNCLMIHNCFHICDSSLWILYLSHCSSKKYSRSCTFFGFPVISAYFRPFQQYDFEIHLLTQRTIKELIHNYYKRLKHLLMLKKKTKCIKSRTVNFWTGRSYFI